MGRKQQQQQQQQQLKRGDARNGDGDGERITDPRFSKVHTDPRFRKMPQSKLKITVDNRFERMFTDKSFVDPFSVDKRGRPTKKKSRGRTLERYYKLEDSKEQQQKALSGSSSDEDEDVAVAADLGKEGMLERRYDGEDAGTKEDSSEEDEVEDEQSSSDSSSEDESESSESSSEAEDAEDQEPEEEKVATTEQETRRLAVVNMDWTYIKATDLLVLFNSFLPKGGRIESVTVFPSQFGLEQMKQEETQGPQMLREDNESDDDEEVKQERLRSYEKSKLRYYFAVVVCDSAATASHLYKSCDGNEFDRTSNIIDLRFIPDDMKFEVPPRDSASEAPEGYEAPRFVTGALQLSNVKLTWDDDEPVRMKTLRRKFKPDEVNEDDYNAYIASDYDDDEEDDVADKVSKYKALLDGMDDAEGEHKTDKGGDVHLEVTFPSGLDHLSKKLLEQKEQKNKQGEETVWEAHLRKKKEKRKSGKKKNDSGTEDEANEVDGIVDKVGHADSDDEGFNDPFFEDANAGAAEKQRPREKPDAAERQKKREERLEKKKEEERSKAELELLIMDDKSEGAVKGYNLKKQRKAKKGKKDRDDVEEEVLASAHLDDPRFSALYTSHRFAIDPTAPQFKRSAHKLRAIAELQKQRFRRQEEPAKEEQEEEGNDSKKRKYELSSLVRSLKRKVAPQS